MRELLVSSNHGPDGLFSLLENSEHSPHFGFGDDYIDDGKSEVVVLPDFRSMRRKFKSINGANQVIITIANPCQCSKVRPFRIIDAHMDKIGLQYFPESLSQADFDGILSESLSSQNSELEFAKIDPAMTLLSNQISIPSEILNYLYTMNDSERKAYAQNRLYNWLASNEGVETLKDDLQSGKRNPSKIPKKLQRLLDILGSEQGEMCRDAVREAISRIDQGKRVNTDKIANMHGMNPHDLRYILQSLGKLNKEN